MIWHFLEVDHRSVFEETRILRHIPLFPQVDSCVEREVLDELCCYQEEVRIRQNIERKEWVRSKVQSDLL
jgi:hypothetical protein